MDERIVYVYLSVVAIIGLWAMVVAMDQTLPNSPPEVGQYEEEDD